MTFEPLIDKNKMKFVVRLGRTLSSNLFPAKVFFFFVWERKDLKSLFMDREEETATSGSNILD